MRKVRNIQGHGQAGLLSKISLSATILGTWGSMAVIKDITSGDLSNRLPGPIGFESSSVCVEKVLSSFLRSGGECFTGNMAVPKDHVQLGRMAGSGSRLFPRCQDPGCTGHSPPAESSRAESLSKAVKGGWMTKTDGWCLR